MEINSHSQYGEDAWIWQYLELPKSGVFIEIGAGDGVTFSNTLSFERKGWQGVCAEPDPRQFAQLSRNRRCHVEQSAIGDAHNVRRLHLAPDPNFSGFLSQGPEITVPIKTGYELATRYSINEIDLLSIDTEGTELEVLTSFYNIRPRILIIEHSTYGLPSNRMSVLEALERANYHRVHETEVNFIYVDRR